MKIALAISGFLRSFDKNYDKLSDFIKKYSPDVFIYLTKNENIEDKYKNKEWTEKKIQDLCNPVFLVCENCIKEHDTPKNNAKLKNINKMWYKRYVVSKLIQCREELLEEKYDIVIVLRPDIYFIDSFLDIFESLITESIKPRDDCIFIPDNHKESYNIGKHKIYDNYKHINDCIAIGNSNAISIYCMLYKYINQYISIYNNSSSMLYQYLLDNKIQINEFNIKYKLVLSQCNVIGISGDSGCGKSYISKLFSDLFGYSSLRLECDRYHKWERGDENWKKYTHLNPEANNLDIYSSDLLNLKLGHDIFQVDYDHETGKFTQPEHIHSKNNIIVCGLHTLFNENSNKLINLKIFLDPQEDLRIFWKINRDIIERGYNYDSVIEKINERKKDKQYIQAQRENSDVIISFKTHDNVNINLENIHQNIINPKIYLCVYISKYIDISKLIDFLMFIKYPFKYARPDNEKYIVLEFEDNSFTKTKTFEMLSYLNINFNIDKINNDKYRDGYDGIIQALIIYVCMSFEVITGASLEYDFPINS